MKQNKICKNVLFVLGFIFIVCLMATISVFAFDKVNTYASETKYQEVGNLTVLSQYSNDKRIYLDMPTTIDSGYYPEDETSGWSGAITEANDAIKVNGQSLTSLGYWCQYGGNQYRLTIGNSTAGGDFVKKGDVIVIPAGLVIPTKDKDPIKFVNEYTITFDGTSYTVDFKSGNFKEVGIDSVLVNINSTPTQAMVEFIDDEGNACDLGYTNWVNPDKYTEKLEESIYVNGQIMSTLQGVTIQGMNIKNALCINGYYLPEGKAIVIPEGTVFENSFVKATFLRTFTITYDGPNETVPSHGDYTVTSTSRELKFPEYQMQEGMLSDFTKSSVFRLGGQSYLEAVVDPTTWGVNYHGLVEGSFLTKEEAPAGSTNGGYKFGWETTKGLLYPSVMFKFRNDISFNLDDELVFRLYFSDTLNMSFNFWITSSLTPNIWDAQNIVAGMSLAKGQWCEIHVPISDYLNSNNEIVPIAFTFAYDSTMANEDVAGGYIIFDSVTIAQSEKIVKNNYKVLDISEIVPVTETKTFTGVADTFVEDFDYEKDYNIAFARTDKSVEGVKTQVSISKLSDFSFYFVLNGNDRYFTNGGIYYWINADTIKVGSYNKVYINESLPSSIQAGESFTMEMICVPYYVDGLKTGNYIGLKINGEQVGENAYVSSASCNFGTWFGLYLHNTTKEVSISISPVEKSETPAISLTLSTNLNATTVALKESVGTKIKISGKLYNDEKTEVVIVSGGDFIEIDDEGYITGKANGKAVIKAVMKNQFGEFSSNEIELTIGSGSQGETESKSGCSLTIDYSNGALLLCLAVAFIVAVKKSKKTF